MSEVCGGGTAGFSAHIPFDGKDELEFKDGALVWYSYQGATSFIPEFIDPRGTGRIRAVSPPSGIQ